MITNTELTVYHKVFNKTSKLEEWVRYNYDRVWWFSSKQANVNTGYENANNVEIRIPYEDNIKINNFSIGDILVKGRLTTNITTQSDIKGQIFNITMINDNNFGGTPHIHIGGK